jgi:cleavage and polyadenylation specificity factor subunit 1
MQCYTELTPPTAVSHSISLPFISTKTSSLIIAKTSLLQIFDLKSIVTEAQSNDSDGDAVQDLAADTLDFTVDIALQKLEYTTKLLLVGEYPLSGTVSSLGRVKTLNNKYGTEVLLVAFRDAKISLVQWDPERHSISTISIHYYESTITTSPWAPDLSQCPSYLSVDPSNKCAILRFGPRQIAIIPFRQLEDDLAEDDYDPILDGPREPTSPAKAITNGNSDSITPYAASFVLSLTTLDHDLTFPIHLAFLHEYREPTFGILSSTRSPSASASLERRDIVSYKVFTLDLEQKASTTILSVSNLPTDIYRVVPLPLPVGGALLIGMNVIVHIDQAGKTTAVGVNEFAKQSSNFAMADQSHLNIRLENCTIDQFGEAGDLLAITSNGGLAVISFVLDGRSVATIKIHKVTPAQGGENIPSGVCCTSTIGRGKIFLGNEDNDSIVLGWSRKTTNISRKRSYVNLANDDDDFSLDEDDLEDDDDDIYGGGESNSKTQDRVSSVSEPVVPEALIFRIHDRLPNLAPVGDLTFGRTDGLPSGEENDSDELNHEIIYPNGRGLDGGLLISRREIVPKQHFQMQIGPYSSAWSFYAKPTGSKDLAATGEEALLSADSIYHQFVIISQSVDQATEESSLYSVTPTGLKRTDQGDFDTDGGTIDVGIIANGSWIVHVKTGELRCYNYGKSTCLSRDNLSSSFLLNWISLFCSCPTFIRFDMKPCNAFMAAWLLRRLLWHVPVLYHLDEYSILEFQFRVVHLRFIVFTRYLLFIIRRYSKRNC